MRLKRLLLGFLMLSCAPLAALADTIETDATCARLGRLISTEDLPGTLGAKATRLRGPSVKGISGCSIEFDSLGSKPASPDASPGDFGISLEQHLSHAKASAGRAMLQSGKRPVDVLAQSDRSFLIGFEFGYPYVSFVIDSTEIQLIMRSKSIDVKKVRDLAKSMYERALNSKEIAAYQTYSNQVAAYSALSPLFALRARCSKPDVAGHEAFSEVAAKGRLSVVQALPIAEMNDYAQRWIKINRVDEVLKERLQTVESSTPLAIAEECLKMRSELATFEAKIPQDVIDSLKKR